MERLWPLLLDIVQLGHVEGVGILETPLDASAAATVQTSKLNVPQQVTECSKQECSLCKCCLWKRHMLAAACLW